MAGIFGCGEITTENPNVIIIYADDIGYGDVSCYGATAVKTPNIELGHDSIPQLYNLETDPGEKINLAAKNPELVEHLAKRIDVIRENMFTRRKN